MRIRKYIIEEAREAVLRVAKLRRPQREAFARVHEMIFTLDKDIPQLSPDELNENLRGQGFDVSIQPPEFLFALATGVGKTRLMGAVISFLHRANQTNNCLILSSRSAVLEKLEREAQVSHPKYLFLDSALVPEPNLCFRANIESFTPADSRLNVYILSPQSIAGRDRRFARNSEFRGFSLLEHLSGLNDLVVLVDEAHHLAADEGASWTESVRDLKPRLYFGFTATPRIEPGVNSLYTYDLAQCLREGVFTKAVDLIVETRDAKVSDQDWDRYTIDFGLRRLEIKRRAIAEHISVVPSFPAIEPVLLVCAKDTEHAEEIGKWLIEQRGLEPAELLVTHSDKTQTEEDIQRLVGIDQPGNKIRVVINVFRLTEGWDVTNVYVIVTLRAMATFAGAIQTSGRGLRLPVGRRTGNAEVDTLDVLCCGSETFEDILRKATENFSKDGDIGIGITRLQGTQQELPPPMKEFCIPVVKKVRIEIPKVVSTRDEPALDFDIGDVQSLTAGGATALHLATLERTGLEQGVNYGFDDFVSIVCSRVIAELKYLSDPIHGPDLERLVKRLLEALGASPQNPVSADPVKVALIVADEIDKRHKQQSVSFHTSRETQILETSDVVWRVPENFTEPIPRVPVTSWD